MRRILLTLMLLPSLAAAQPAVTVSPNLRVAPGGRNEPWITVSPTDPNVLLTASQNGDPNNGPPGFGIGAFISRDGGRIWVPVSLPGAANTAFDVIGRFVNAQYVRSGRTV